MRFSKLALVGLFIVGASSVKAQTVINGDFATGDLTGFQVFTTANGNNGPNLPEVTFFDVTGNGASNAAHFNVGQNNFTPGILEGGGIFQNINFSTSGLTTFSAAIADAGVPPTGFGGDNFSGGFFQLLVDNTILDTDDLGFIAAGDTHRSTLRGSIFIDPGIHELRILIERPARNGGPTGTPDQYVTNISVDSQIPSVIPEGSSFLLMSSLLLPLGIILQWHRRMKLRS